MLSGLFTDLVRSREELIAENVLLRQQLVVAARKIKRPAFRPHERGLIAALTGVVPRLRDVVLLVKPDTILRWHREGFRLFWKRKSKCSQREPRLPTEVIELIQRMVRENRLWGAERAKSIAREAARMLPVLSGLVTDVVRSREELIAENLLLRQQLLVASRKVKRPAFRPHERGLLEAKVEVEPA